MVKKIKVKLVGIMINDKREISNNYEQRNYEQCSTYVWWHWILVFIAFGITLILAWWQFSRFNSVTGSYQNLGYALQWPVFGAFVIVGYVKFRKLDRQTHIKVHHYVESYSPGSVVGDTSQEEQGTSTRNSQNAHEVPPGVFPARAQGGFLNNSTNNRSGKGKVYDGSSYEKDSAEQELEQERQRQEYNRYLKRLAQQQHRQ